MLAQSDQIQTASVDFFWPIAAAYASVCVVWLIMKATANSRWNDEQLPVTDRPWLDFGMIFVAAAGTFGLGAAYRNDWLIPPLASPWTSPGSMINLCLPFAPLFLVLIFRRQSLQTVWISRTALPWKLATGILSAIAGVLVFLGLRNEFGRVPEILQGLTNVNSWVHAPAVFLEAVAVAFVFIRLRWITHPAVALLIPCLLFAAAHVPSGIANGRTPLEIFAFFAFNTILTAFIFSVVTRSADVIWIAIPHFVLDIATGVFGQA